MNRYLKYLIAIVIMAVVALAVRLSVGPGITAARQEIEKALPIGSTAEDVIGFLDSKGIEHSKYLMPERQINARLGVTAKGLVSEKSLFAEFRFDGQHRLKSISIETVGTSL
jgi:hypothetical protein